MSFGMSLEDGSKLGQELSGVLKLFSVLRSNQKPRLLWQLIAFARDKIVVTQLFMVVYSKAYSHIVYMVFTF